MSAGAGTALIMDGSRPVDRYLEVVDLGPKGGQERNIVGHVDTVRDRADRQPAGSRQLQDAFYGLVSGGQQGFAAEELNMRAGGTQAVYGGEDRVDFLRLQDAGVLLRQRTLKTIFTAQIAGVRGADDKTHRSCRPRILVEEASQFPFFRGPGREDVAAVVKRFPYLAVGGERRRVRE